MEAQGGMRASCIGLNRLIRLTFDGRNGACQAADAASRWADLCAHSSGGLWGIWARLAVQLLAILGVGGTVYGLRAAQLDEVRLRLVQPCPASFHWDNVEGPPQWVCGPRPRFSRAWGLHTVVLAPGDRVTFKVPARSMVRVFRPDGPLDAHDLDLRISNGSGLYCHRRPDVTSDGKSLLAVPDHASTALASVRRPRGHACGIVVALFTSRYDVPVEIPSYDNIVPGCGPRFKLSQPGAAQVEPFYLLKRGTPSRFRFTGPIRLAVETRLRYPADESRRRQTHRLFVSLDGQPFSVMEFGTASELRTRILVDGCDELLGRQETAYLDVPPGPHCLDLDATASVYFRIRYPPVTDYLLPRLNQPAWLAATRHGVGMPWGHAFSLWDITHHDAYHLARAGPEFVGALEQIARRTARDNAHREGGLRAMMMVRAAAARRPDAPQVRALAETMENSYTTYRNLLPSRQPNPDAASMAWFFIRHLRDPGRPGRDMMLGQQHIDDALESLSRGAFVPLASLQESASVYRLPATLGPSQLRVVVDRDRLRCCTPILVQYDSRPPILLEAECGVELPCSDYLPSLAEAGLSALAWQDPGFHAGTLGGPFSQTQIPGRMAVVATAELMLPADVREIRVWSPAPDAGNARVALQYCTSKRYRLSESEYLDLQCRAGGGPPALVAELQTESISQPQSFAMRELHNHWLPLIRHLRAHERNLLASVNDADDHPAAGPDLNERARRALQARARQLAEQGHWLPALEAWSDLLPCVAGPDRREALLGRVIALDHLGESFLADRELRGLFLLDEDPQVRHEALDYLRSLYRRAEDLDALEQLLAVAVLREPTAQHLADLSALMLENQRYDFALILALAIPPEQRPAEVVLRAAYQKRWWSVYRQAVAQLPQPATRHYWQAHYHLRLGQYSRALEHFRQAGELGQTFAAHLSRGQAIHRRLCQPNLEARLRAIREWEQWYAAHPGPWAWQEAPGLVATCHGAEQVYVVERDIYAQYFRAPVNEPLQLLVQGPVDIRLEARPIHPKGSEEPVDGWLNVRAPGQFHPIPICGNRPSTGLQIVGEEEQIPGWSVQTQLSLGPGRHEVEVSSDAADVLVRVWVRRPELQLPVLPPVNRETMDAAVAGRFHPHLHHKTAHGDDRGVFILPTCPSDPAIWHPLLCRACAPASDEPCPGSELDRWEAARWALRCGKSWDGDASWLLERARREDNMSGEELVLALARLGQLGSYRQQLLNGPWRLPAPLRRAVCLATGAPEAALRVPSQDRSADILQQMILILRMAEADSWPDPRWAVLGREHFDQHRQVPGLQELHDRLTPAGTWSSIRTVDASAGLHGRRAQGWLPETPATRIRRCFLRGRQPDENMLSGYSVLVLAMQNVTPTTLTMSVAAAPLGYLPAAPMTVAWQQDQNPPRTIVLSADSAPQTIRMDVPAGTHRIRLWIDQPRATQYARVQWREQPSMTAEGATDQHVVVVRETERFYHVATHEEPVRLRVAGPRWIRVDEFRDGATISRYRAVLQREKDLEIAPAPGQDVALLRIFEYVPDPDKKTPPPITVTRQPEPLPPPWIEVPPVTETAPEVIEDDSWFWPTSADWFPPQATLGLLPPDMAPFTLELPEAYPLGGQEDGTWSVGMALFQRRPLEEGMQVTSTNKFMQWSVAHRYFDPWSNRNDFSDLRFRVREQSGPTLGLEHRRWYSLPLHSFGVQVAASAYVQRPAGALVPSWGGTEWSAKLAGRVTRRWDVTDRSFHVGSLSAFGRLLSMDQFLYDPGRVDQDIFTVYKSDHRSGLSLSDTLIFQPWLDVRWWVRPLLVTNDDFDVTSPDHVTVRTGWSQAVGCAELDFSYRLARFFQDADRPRARTQNLLYFDVVGDCLGFASRGPELGLSVQHDLDRGKTSANIALMWYRSNGRGYRDVHPNEFKFLRLRQQRAAWRARPDSLN